MRWPPLANRYATQLGLSPPQLQQMLEVTREEKLKKEELRQAEEISARLEKEEKDAARRKAKQERTRRQREKVAQWKQNGGRPGGGKKVTKLAEYKNYLTTP